MTYSYRVLEFRSEAEGDEEIIRSAVPRDLAELLQVPLPPGPLVLLADPVVNRRMYEAVAVRLEPLREALRDRNRALSVRFGRPARLLDDVDPTITEVYVGPGEPAELVAPPSTL